VCNLDEVMLRLSTCRLGSHVQETLRLHRDTGSSGIVLERMLDRNVPDSSDEREFYSLLQGR